MDVISPKGQLHTDRIMKVNGDNFETARLVLLKKLELKGLQLVTVKKAYPFAVCHAFNHRTFEDVRRGQYKRFPLPFIPRNLK